MIVAYKNLKCGRRAIILKEKVYKIQLSIIFENLNRELYLTYKQTMVFKIYVIKMP